MQSAPGPAPPHRGDSMTTEPPADLKAWMDIEPEPASTTADAFVARVSTNLANVLSVHHGHMPEIELTGPTTARGVWAMFDWLDHQNEWNHVRQGYGHY